MTLQSRVGKCLANLLEEWCGGADLLSLETCQSYHCFLLTLKSYCSQIGLVPLANLSPELRRSSYVFSVSKFRFQKESTQGNELNWKKYIWRMGNAVAGTVEVRRGLQWVSMRICLGGQTIAKSFQSSHLINSKYCSACINDVNVVKMHSFFGWFSSCWSKEIVLRVSIYLLVYADGTCHRKWKHKVDSQSTSVNELRLWSSLCVHVHLLW